MLLNNRCGRRHFYSSIHISHEIRVKNHEQTVTVPKLYNYIRGLALVIMFAKLTYTWPVTLLLINLDIFIKQFALTVLSATLLFS